MAISPHKIIKSTRSLLLVAIAAGASACVPALHTPPPLPVDVYKLPQLPEGKPLAATSLPLVPGIQQGTIGAFYRDYVSAELPALPGTEPASQRSTGVSLAQSSVALLSQAHSINPDLLPYAMAGGLASSETQIAASATAAQDGGVERLFAAADALGYQINDVSMDGDVATVAISPLPGRLPQTTDKLAKLVLADLPGITRTVIKDDRPGAGIIARDFNVQRAPSPPSPAIDGPTDRIVLTPPHLPEPAIPGNGNDVTRVAQKVFDDLGKIGFTARRFSIDGESAYLEFSQETYRDNVVATGHAAHVVAQDAPPAVKVITLDAVQNGSQALYVSVMRGDFEKALTEKGSSEEVWVHAVLAGSDSDLPHGNTQAAANSASEPAAASPAAAQDGGVDELFAAAEALGYQIDDVSMDGDVATLSVSPLPGRLPQTMDGLAKLVLANLPGITRIVINDARPGAAIVQRNF